MTDEPVPQLNAPGFWPRPRSWLEQHKIVVAAAASALLTAFLVAGGCIAWVAHDQTMRRAATAAAVQAALQESMYWQDQGHWPEALSAARRAHALLDLPGANPALKVRVDDRLSDLELPDQLQQIRMPKPTLPDLKRANREYEQAFQGHGSDAKAHPAK